MRQNPALHSDTLDPILIVQAAAEGMALLTADRKVAAYGGPAVFVRSH